MLLRFTLRAHSMPYGNGTHISDRGWVTYKRTRYSPNYTTGTVSSQVSLTQAIDNNRAYIGAYRPLPSGDYKPHTRYYAWNREFSYGQDGVYTFYDNSGKKIFWEVGPQVNLTRDGFFTFSNLFLGSNVQNELLLAIHKNRQAASMSLGVTLAESKETLSFVAESAGKLARFGRNMYRGNWVAAYRSLDLDTRNLRSLATSAAKYDLAYKFGVRPIVNDVYDAISTIDSGIVTGNGIYHGSAFTKRKLDFVKTYGKANARVRGLVLKRVSTTWRLDPNRWRTGQQLGLTNPFQVAFEVIPFSFLLDGLVPISSWLGQFDLADQMSTMLGGTVSDFYKIRWNGIYGTSKNEHYYIPDAWFKESVLDRKILTSSYVGIPPLPDGIHNAASKALTAFELLLSLRRK